MEENFKTLVLDHDLTSVRVSLKDSIIYDPTLSEFDDMLKYACSHLPDLFQEDNKALYSDSEINKSLLNEQLAYLMTNFSKERINYIRSICDVVYKDRIQLLKKKKRSKWVKLSICIGIFAIVAIATVLLYTFGGK